MKLSAAIVCLQRSGSHLLASCLDSHPLVGSYGEFIGRPQPAPFPPDPIVVGIIMYDQWDKALAAGVEIERIIHLVRDPRQSSVSALRNRQNRAIHGAAHRAHALRGEPLPVVHPVDPSAVERVAAGRAAELVAFRERLRGRDVLEVRYEALTGDRSISALPDAESRRLLEWLGLPFARLHTSYVKTGPPGGA
ncbi:MAG: sulfotransferase family protein [Candidatus Binatia bacterium]